MRRNGRVKLWFRTLTREDYLIHRKKHISFIKYLMYTFVFKDLFFKAL